MYSFFRNLAGLTIDELPDHAAALTQAGFRQFGDPREHLFGLVGLERWQLPPAK